MSFNDKYFHLFDQIDIYIYILLQNRIKIGFFDRATDITTLLISRICIDKLLAFYTQVIRIFSANVKQLFAAYRILFC